MPVLPWLTPDASVAHWRGALTGARGEGFDLPALLSEVVERSNHLHHPGYVGHQVTPPLPAAALCDLVGSLLNNGSAVYEMGPVTTAFERLVIGMLARQLGMPAGADGVFTSGGSAGNLTALLAARQARAGFDVWSDGNAGGPPLAFLCSAEAHYSLGRALQIMGLGAKAAWPVPVDDRFRLDPRAAARGPPGGRGGGVPGDRRGGQCLFHRHRRLRSAGGDRRLLRGRAGCGCTWTAPTGPAWRSRTRTGRWCRGSPGPIRWCGTPTS